MQSEEQNAPETGLSKNFKGKGSLIWLRKNGWQLLSQAKFVLFLLFVLMIGTAKLLSWVLG